MSANLDTTLDFQTIIDMGFVPSALIIGGWICALILTLVCIYYLVVYSYYHTRKKP